MCYGVSGGLGDVLVLRLAARSSEIHFVPGRARRAGKPCAVMAGASSQC